MSSICELTAGFCDVILPGGYGSIFDKHSNTTERYQVDAENEDERG